MLSPSLTLGVLGLYLLFLLFLGFYAEKKIHGGRHFSNNGLFYSLSLAIYCTSWTYYGSIGNASRSGFLFATVHIGSTIGAILWGPILKKLIRIKNKYRITSIIDFISARYNKSVGIGMVLAVFVIFGFIPYNALQIRSIMSTTRIMLPNSVNHSDVPHLLIEWIILAVISVFIIVFGLRRLEPTERHPGMISALAIESIVKLVAVLAGGFFIVYGLSGGIKELIEALPESVAGQAYTHVGFTNMPDLFEWLSWLFLASVAVIFLPRQFHVAIIENGDEKHVKTAQWLFPLYLFLSNIFILPIAVYGLKAGASFGHRDSLLLEAPLLHGNNLLALFIYIGGFSAGIGMITVSVITISTMVTNHLLLPLAESYSQLRFLRGNVLKIRWLAAILIVGLAYLYQKYLETDTALVVIGMVSFVAAFQFIPPIILGLYWPKVNSKGALFGILAGCITWAYTLFIPSFMKSNLLPGEWLHEGPFGVRFLRPEALFDLEGLSSISHGFLWSSVFNFSALIIGSLLFKASAEEIIHAEEFLMPEERRKADFVNQVRDIDILPKKTLILNLLGGYFNKTEAENVLTRCLDKAHISPGTSQISIAELAELNSEIERSLAGVIGSATAHHAVRSAQIFNSQEEKSLSNIYAQMLSTLQVSPTEFKKKVHFHIEKENLLRRQKEELEIQLEHRMKEVQEMQAQLIQSSKLSALGEMAGGIAHEINSPLTTMHLMLEQMKSMLNENPLDLERVNSSIERLLAVTDRIAAIIKGLRLFSRSDVNLPMEEKDLREILLETLSFCQEKFKHNMIELKNEVLEGLLLKCRPVQISQVILNLLNNAYDAIQPLDERWIHIAAFKKDQYIELQITDSGLGIPRDVAEKIMQPFYSTKDVGKGTGLGLSISSGIVRDHGGELVLDVGAKNTRFIVRFPRI